MTNIVEKLKSDLYNVFIKGDSDTTQQARVFVFLFLPVVPVILALSHLAIY